MHEKNSSQYKRHKRCCDLSHIPEGYIPCCRLNSAQLDDTSLLVHKDPAVPVIMHDVRINRLVVSHFICADHRLIRPFVEPCSPEAEGGVSTYIAFAVAHEHKVLNTVFAVVPVYDGVSALVRKL